MYATLGTVYNADELLTPMIEALAHERLNLIVTVGPDKNPATVDPRRPNVRVERWIPHTNCCPDVTPS